MPQLVPKESLTQANSIMQGITGSTVLAGQGAGGILFRVLAITDMLDQNTLPLYISAGTAVTIYGVWLLTDRDMRRFLSTDISG